MGSFRARTRRSASLPHDLVGPRTSASSVEPFTLALWWQRRATKRALLRITRLAFLVLLISPVASISAESDQGLAAKITGVWVGRDIVDASDIEVETTYRADGTMSQLAKFSEDRRGYKVSVKGRWKVEQGQLVSVRESFSGQTEHSVKEIVAVTDKNLLLRAANGRLIHFIRK